MNKKKIFFAIINMVFFIMMFNAHTYPIIYGDENNFIKIIPTNLEFEIIAGSSHENSFILKNEGPEDFSYNITYSTIFNVDEFTLGLWNFNEGVGDTVHDSSGNKFLGEIYGATWVNGRFGEGLCFDGWDDFVSFSNFSYSDMSSVTMETWIKFDSADGWSPIGPVKFWEYGVLYNEQDYLRTHVWANGLKWFDVPMELADNSWHYVVMSYDSSLGELRLYLDGTLLESRFEGYGIIKATSNNLIIGRSWTENMWDFFAGNIDETRVSRIARGEDEIWDVFHRANEGSGEIVKILDREGTVRANSEAEVPIILNATGINPGIYYRNLTILGNSPQNGKIMVPVKLNVLPLNHDLSLGAVRYERTIEANNRINVEAVIKNLGTVTEKDVRVKLIIQDEVVNRRTIDSIQPGEDETINLRWTPKISGEYKGKIIIDRVEGEEHEANNRKSIIIKVLGEPKINVDKEKITINATKEHMIKSNIMISNTGTSNLEYMIYDTNSSIIFYDDMEASPTRWSHHGEFDTWELGTPRMGPEKPFSGEKCWGTDLDNNYKDLSDSYIQTEVIDLTRRKDPVLEFWNWYSIHSFEDRAYVEIWDEEKWIRLNGDGFYGFSNGWIEQNFDLNQFVGKKIKVRFRLDTNEYIRDKGWYIDNVIIRDQKVYQKDLIRESPVEGYILPKDTQNITIFVEPGIYNNTSYSETITIRSNDLDKSITDIYVLINFKTPNDFLNNTESEHLNKTTLLLELGPDIIIDEDYEFTFTIYNLTTNLTDLECIWSFYDGKQINLYDKNPKYTFNIPGIYEVRLNIIGYNTTTTDDYNIYVLDITDPIANAGHNITGKIGEFILFDGTKSWDNVNINKYFWDFGDGINGTGAIVFHSYEKEGEYLATLKVIDLENNSSTDEILVTIISDGETSVKKDDGLNINSLILGILLSSSIIVVILTLSLIYRK